MNKIKLGKRTWIDAKGKKQKAHTFTYKDQGKKKVIQSPNKQWLEQEAEKILLRIGNINPKNMNVVLEIPLDYAWGVYRKKCQNRVNEPTIRFTKTTFKEYKEHFKHIKKHCGNVDLTKIDVSYIADFLKKITDLKIDYKKKIFHTFSRIYDTQVGLGETDPLKINVFKTATFFKDDEKSEPITHPKINFDEWNFDRINTIISKVPSIPYQLMFKLMAETSCRPSEARAAQRKNFHFKRNIPVFEITNSVDYEKGLAPPKTKAGYRELEISARLKDQLIDYMNTLPEDQECIFLNSKGKFYDLKNMITCLDKVVESLNLTLPVARKTYFFRHWNASYWCYHGKYTNPSDLAMHMGDLDVKFINTTYIKKYAVSKESAKYSEHQNAHYNWN
jgi:integrase|tara:strand:+ start:13 stop:1182 length:1170 start_codon:yes stop_codon:yes gene_type:complete